jgi:hypothetical protein
VRRVRSRHRELGAIAGFVERAHLD